MINRPSVRMQRTIRGASSAALAGTIALCLHFDDPFWSVITVFALMTETSFEEHFKKGVLRIWGTILGAIIGIIVTNLCANNHLFFLLAIFIIGYISVYKFHSSTYPYPWFLGGLTAYMIMMVAPYSLSNLYATAIWRTVEISTGVIAVWLVNLFVYPVHAPIVAKPAPLVTEEFKIQLYKLSIKAGLAVLITFLLLLKLNWYGGAVGAVSAILITSPRDFTTAKRMAKLRIGGCFFGAVAGLIALNLCFQNVAVLIFWLIVGCAIFAWYATGPVNVAYAGLQGGIAFGVALIPLGGLIPNDISQPLERIAGIFLGVIVAQLVNLLLWPNLFKPLELGPPNSS